MINEKQAQKYCNTSISEIENYEKAVNDTTHMWHCHHRLECVDGVFTPLAELKKKDLYYNRPASELIFLTVSAHRSLHCKDPQFSIKMSDAHKGKSPYNKGKKISNELKRKISESTKHTWQDLDYKQKQHDARKRPEFLQKMRDVMIDRHWYTDGINNKLAYECPGEGWHLGMTYHKKD